MESFEHTRLKPLSIVLAVEQGGTILAVKVASMPYKGSLSAIARQKYGYRKDERAAARKEVLAILKKLAPTTLYTDAHPGYPKLIKQYLPGVNHTAVKADHCHPVKRIQDRRRNKKDPLFALNHCAAKIRHDLSRMARKVWTTTKKIDRLQAHLDLYTAYLNGYSLRT